jgi:hypothetical protein
MVGATDRYPFPAHAGSSDEGQLRAARARSGSKPAATAGHIASEVDLAGRGGISTTLPPIWSTKPVMPAP